MYISYLILYLAFLSQFLFAVKIEHWLPAQGLKRLTAGIPMRLVLCLNINCLNLPNLPNYSYRCYNVNYLRVDLRSPCMLCNRKVGHSSPSP